MKKFPAVFITIAFCAGIIWGRQSPYCAGFIFYLAVIFLIFCLALAEYRNVFSLALMLLWFFLGALLFLLSPDAAGSWLNYHYADPSQRVEVCGLVKSYPQTRGVRTIFILQTQQLKTANHWQPAAGDLSAQMPLNNDLFYGDRVVLCGRLSQPRYRNSRAQFLLRVAKDGQIRKIGAKAGNPLILFCFKIRRRLQRMFNSSLSVQSSAVLNALVLGIRQDLPISLKQAFIRTGTAHIIAISGLHIGVTAFIILLLLKLLRIPRACRCVAALSILIFYAIIAGFSIPVMRATIMAGVVLTGYAFSQQTELINSLFLCGLVLLLLRPGELFEAGFQLSFASVLSLVLLTPQLSRLLFSRIKTSRLLKPVRELFCASLSVWLGLLPLTAYYFRIISPVAILANMLVVPYMGILITCAFVFLAMCLLSPCLAGIFAPVVEAAVFLLLKLVYFAEKAPFAYFRLP